MRTLHPQAPHSFPFPPTMEIKLEYVRKRSEFGRPCSFSDYLAEVTVDIPPDPSLADDFIPQDPVDFAFQEGPVMALHEVGGHPLGREEGAPQAVSHVEGGRPEGTRCVRHLLGSGPSVSPCPGEHGAGAGVHQGREPRGGGLAPAR